MDIQQIPRDSLVQGIELRLGQSPVTALLGARQVGKTTLAREMAERAGGATVFDLESASGRAALELTPELTLADCKGLVIRVQMRRRTDH